MTQITSTSSLQPKRQDPTPPTEDGALRGHGQPSSRSDEATAPDPPADARCMAVLGCLKASRGAQAPVAKSKQDPTRAPAPSKANQHNRVPRTKGELEMTSNGPKEPENLGSVLDGGGVVPGAGGRRSGGVRGWSGGVGGGTD